MIRKWRNRLIIYLLLTVFLAIIAFYLNKSVLDTNNKMAKLKNEGNLVDAEMVELPGSNYADGEAHLWRFVLTIDGKEVKGITTRSYTLDEYKAMDGIVKAYYLMQEDGTVMTFEQYYVDNFVPWSPTQSIMLWVLAGITLAIALYYVGRNMFVLYILTKGEASIGTFEEAFHPKLGGRYYQVKYTFVRDGSPVTVVSPAIYDGREADKLKDYFSFQVRYIGKYSVIDQKL